MADLTPSKVILDDFTGLSKSQLAALPFREPYIGLRKIEILGVLWENTRKKLDERHFRDKHLWYPRPSHSVYELRDGPPPPDRRRPEHLRGLDLRISLRDFLRKINASLYTREYFQNATPAEVRTDLLKLINGKH